MPIDLVPQLVSAAIRALGLGLVALVGLLLFRIRSSAARHATWTVVLAGMLLQIPLGVVAPTVPLKALPTLPRSTSRTRVMESARISVLAAQTLGPASHTRTGPNGRWVSSSGRSTAYTLRSRCCCLSGWRSGHGVCAESCGMPSPSPAWVPASSNRSYSWYQVRSGASGRGFFCHEPGGTGTP